MGGMGKVVRLSLMTKAQGSSHPPPEVSSDSQGPVLLRRLSGSPKTPNWINENTLVPLPCFHAFDGAFCYGRQVSIPTHSLQSFVHPSVQSDSHLPIQSYSQPATHLTIDSLNTLKIDIIFSVKLFSLYFQHLKQMPGDKWAFTKCL